MCRTRDSGPHGVRAQLTRLTRARAVRRVPYRPPTATLVVALAACAGPSPDAATQRDGVSERDGASASDVAPVRDVAGQRAVAFTFDDLPVVSTTGDTAIQWSVTRGILSALRAADAPAIGFVNENKLGAGAAHAARIRMLRAWLDAGHDLGNHGYAHLDLNSTPLDVYTADITRGEEATTRLRGAQPAFFRHPFLHAGNDSAKKAGLERFLTANDYRVAPVTIDNQEWIFARAYDLALDADDRAHAQRIADAYVVYMDTVFGFHEAQARAIVGRDIAHVLLLHANRINRDLLDELLELARRRGYVFITLEQALRDSAYARSDAYIGTAGITWLHRWAITDGLDRSIFRGEPEAPAFVAEAVN